MFEAGSCQIPLHYSWFRAGSEQAPSQLRTSSELAPNRLGASSEPASVMEFGFKSDLVATADGVQYQQWSAYNY